MNAFLDLLVEKEDALADAFAPLMSILHKNEDPTAPPEFIKKYCDENDVIASMMELVLEKPDFIEALERFLPLELALLVHHFRSGDQETFHEDFKNAIPMFVWSSKQWLKTWR